MRNNMHTLLRITGFAILALGGLSRAVANVTQGKAADVTIDVQHSVPAPPSSPSKPQGQVADQQHVSLDWNAVTPGAGRTINHYDIYLNGVKIGSATGTHFVAAFDPSPSALQFYSVVAIDDLGRASPASAEMLVNAEVPATFQAQEGYIDDEKVGMIGFSVGSQRKYKHIVGSHHIEGSTGQNEVGGPWTVRSDLTIDEQLTSTTGPQFLAPYNTTVTGNVTVTGADGSVNNAQWLLDPSGPRAIQSAPTIINPVPFFNTLPHLYARGVTSVISDTLWAFASDPTGGLSQTYSMTLSDEDTDAVLFQRSATHRNAIDAELTALPWDYYIMSSSSDIEPPWVTSFLPYAPAEMIAGRWDATSGGSVGIRFDEWGYYQFSTSTRGILHVRWLEVLEPNDGSARQVVGNHEVSLYGGDTGTQTDTYTANPPVVSGGGNLYICQVPTGYVLQTPSVNPAPGQPRLYSRDALFVGQSVDLDLGSSPQSAANGPISDAIQLCQYGGSVVAQVAGDAGAVRLVAVDPAVVSAQGLDAAVKVGTDVPSGTNLIPLLYPHSGQNGPRAIVAVGASTGASVITLHLNNYYYQTDVIKTITVYAAPTLAVDANRDGTIDLPPSDSTQSYADQTTAAAPYRFWINDDNDSGEEKTGPLDDFPLSPATTGRNADDDHVNGIRDLVDFFPVYLDVKQLLAVLPPGVNGVSYTLKQEDAAVGIVFTSYTRAQVFDYLHGTPSGLDTGFGPTLTQKAGEATVTKITATGVDLFLTSPAFQARIQNNDGGVILVEVSKATTKPLVLEVRKGIEVITTVLLTLKTDPVETMFRYYNIRSQAHGTAIAADNQGPNYGATAPTDAPNDPFQDVANRKNAVFVHGYNVNSKQAQGSAAEIFKRLYWAQSKAKFYAVLWRGDDGQLSTGATPDYHRNVGHAWQQGPYLRDLLTSLTGDTAVIAHSLGNLVAQVALTYERDPSNAARLRPAAHPASVKNYFAIDAAVPLEALAEGDVTADSKAKMRHPDWAEYDTQERLWPTQWYALFVGTSDGRSGLTWRNVFAGLDVGTNFYSSGEEVLANPINDSVPLWEPLFGGGLRAWVSQEKHKGGAGPAAPFFRSWTGGWIENKAWYVPIVPTPPPGSPQTRRRFASEAQDVAAPGGVPTSALASEPFFQRFQAIDDGTFYLGYQGSRLHAPIGDANADDEARKLVTVSKCLGEAIPALSFPQGSNESTRFKGQGMGGNFNLDTSAFKNGWPSSRPDTNWKHSDCLNVAYTFNFPLYDKMTHDGGLK
jgi:hypothetical protein